MVEQLSTITPRGKVSFIYQPLEYARAVYADYLNKYASTKCEVLLLGMNPGPFGMAQTGIPFGDPLIVREWLGLRGKVGRPGIEHPKRPVLGLDSTRREISGKRLWGWAQNRFTTPENFFSRFFVINYCPLLFLHAPNDKKCVNLTPEHLLAQDRELIYRPCDEFLRETFRILRPRWVVGVGKFALGRIETALDGEDFVGGWVLHPSGANPLANADWEGQAESALLELGIALP